MNRKGQGGTAAIWGAGVVLIGIGAVLFLDSYKEFEIGLSTVATLEAFVGMALLVFGIISLYLAHK